jgi:glycosyltransferase involved in cell wall biosynthesis
MNIALSYDRINKMGGAERVLLSFHRIWPDAPVMTPIHDKTYHGWSDVFRVISPSFGSTRFVSRHHEWFAWLTPWLTEQLSFDGYDTVLSMSSGDTKGIITKPEVCHIDYCLTPTRYLWSGHDAYADDPGIGISSFLVRPLFRFLLPFLRRWDLVASSRPDVMIAISKRVQKRIMQFYHRKSTVIYPPVDTDMFVPSVTPIDDGYFLTVGRLVSYKRIDLVIEAAQKVGRRLIVIGRGRQLAKLQRLVNNDSITFVTEHLTDEKMRAYYQRCHAFVFAGDEDFGIAAAEANACGKPVICYSESGIAEIVRDTVTGLFFRAQSVSSLVAAMEQFETMEFSVSACRKNAERFSTERFLKEIRTTVEQSTRIYRKGMEIV